MKIWREKNMVVDGYSITVNYQKTEQGKHHMETLQIFSKKQPFLPFYVVVKLAKKHLNEENLHLAEVLKEGRKIYVWISFVDKKGRSTSSPYDLEGEDCFFEGLEYLYLKSGQINFS